MHELAYYRQVRFGKASEAFAGEQRLLFEETVDMDVAAIEEELETPAPAKRQRKRAGRQPLPPHLERIAARVSPGNLPNRPYHGEPWSVRGNLTDANLSGCRD